MKLSDLFLPKHVHSDPEVRKKAITRIKDTALLAQIAEKDSDQYVRELASKRINDLKDMRGA
jgi:hypothetical protein